MKTEVIRWLGTAVLVLVLGPVTQEWSPVITIPLSFVAGFSRSMAVDRYIGPLEV